MTLRISFVCHRAFRYVLEYEDNGYVKINFMNIDGPLTGYIYKDYLTTDSSIAVQW